MPWSLHPAQVAERVAVGLEHGGELAIGGRRPTQGPLARGAFYPPTIVTDVEDDSPLVRDEVFGPVLPVLSYRDLDDVIGRANRSRYGLSSYVFTRDLSASQLQEAFREVLQTQDQSKVTLFVGFACSQ